MHNSCTFYVFAFTLERIVCLDFNFNVAGSSPVFVLKFISNLFLGRKQKLCET